MSCSKELLPEMCGRPHQLIPTSINLSDINTAYTPSAKRLESLDFAEVDGNDDNLFNEILWKGIKGELSQLPVPRRSAFVKIVKKDLD